MITALSYPVIRIGFSKPVIAHIGLPLLRRSALRLQRVFNTVVAAPVTALKLLRNGFVSTRRVRHRRVVSLH
jgi:hypothetical protein